MEDPLPMYAPRDDAFEEERRKEIKRRCDACVTDVAFVHDNMLFLHKFTRL